MWKIEWNDEENSKKWVHILFYFFIIEMDYKVFGCKTNKYFAEKWLAHPHIEGKWGYFIASCVVTDRAKAKWVKHALRILQKLNENEVLFLSGCGNIRDGVIDPQFFEVYRELLPYRGQIELLPEDPQDYTVTPEERKRMMQTKVRSLGWILGKRTFTRKHMVIQTGCDNFCTFCLTVQARGRHRFRPKEEILEEIREFVAQWGKEVVFTGINLWAWWASSSNEYQDSRIFELIRAVLDETDLERLRISSLGVEFCTPDLIALFSEKRIVAYTHLSIQSGSSQILRSMNRHYDGDKVRQVLASLRSIERDDGVNLNIGADLIVGFPGEDDDAFHDSLTLIETYGITQLHAFPFSPHIDHYNVPAWVFDWQISQHIRDQRQQEILESGKRAFHLFEEQNIGSRFRVLVEKALPHGGFEGWTENYIRATNENFSPYPDQVPARGEILIGTLIAVNHEQKIEDL
jgi:MiaB/RimO family radical SAM methylthiotransferase